MQEFLEHLKEGLSGRLETLASTRGFLCDDHAEFLTIETLLRDTDRVKMDLLIGLSRAMLDLATDLSLGLATKAWIAVVVCSCADITG
jgi:hypothetical protein